MHLHFACCINAFTIKFNENKQTQPKICILLAKVLNETTIAIKTKESNLIRNILKLVTAIHNTHTHTHKEKKSF